MVTKTMRRRVESARDAKSTARDPVIGTMDTRIVRSDSRDANPEMAHANCVPPQQAELGTNQQQHAVGDRDYGRCPFAPALLRLLRHKDGHRFGFAREPADGRGQSRGQGTVGH